VIAEAEVVPKKKERPYEKNPWLIGLLLLGAIFIVFGPDGRGGISQLVAFVRIFLMCMFSLIVTFSFKRFSRSCCVNFFYCFIIWMVIDTREPEIYIIVNMLTMLIALYYRKNYYLRNSLASSTRFPVSILDLFTITLASVGYILLLMELDFGFLYSVDEATWKPILQFTISMALFGTGVNSIIWIFRRTVFWKVVLVHSIIVIALFTFIFSVPIDKYSPQYSFQEIIEKVFWFAFPFIVLLVFTYLFFLLLRLNGTYLERFTDKQKTTVRETFATTDQLGPLDRESEVG